MTVDRALSGFLTLLLLTSQRLPRALRRAVAVGGCGLAATLSWPWLPLRARARAVALPLAPWRWGASMGANLAALLDAAPPIESEGWPDHPGPAVVLAAHCGPWEAGAQEIARRGLRPLVLAAPWPRLPRTADRIASLRARSGVRSLPRGRAALIEATRHLRDGGWVLVLVDSLNPSRRGRRPAPFVDDPVAPPDGLVSWAARQGAAVILATADAHRFQLAELLPSGPPRRLSPDAITPIADAALAALREGARARPHEWAWVRALASLTLAFLGVSLGSLSGCAPAPLPPLPLHPEDWRAELTELSWEGLVEGRQLALTAARARVRWTEQATVGAFEDITLLSAPVGEGYSGSLDAASALGNWPVGPLTLREVRFTLRGPDLPASSGEVPELRWSEGALRCGGCLLERLNQP